MYARGVVAEPRASAALPPAYNTDIASKSDFIFRYRVRNGAEYKRALVRRGSLPFWVDEHAVRGWRAAHQSGPRGGRPQLYSDTAIECALVVKSVFHLSLRSAQGFLESIIDLMGVELPVPDFTTVCRRQAGSRYRSR